MVDEKSCSSLKRKDSDKKIGFDDYVCEITGKDCVAVDFREGGGSPRDPDYWCYNKDRASLCPAYNLLDNAIVLVNIVRLFDERDNLSSRTKKVSDIIKKLTEKI